MGIYIQWKAPITDSTWTHARVERGITSTGPFTQLTEQVITDVSYYDTTGLSGHYYRVYFWDNVNLIASDYSSVFQGYYANGYATIDEFRNYTNTQSTEYTDTAVMEMILRASQEIDFKTNRTWKAVYTVVDEYYDGTGSNKLYLQKNDIVSLDSLSIDRYRTGVFESVDLSTVKVYSEIGKIIIDYLTFPIVNSLKFPLGYKSVKVSYKYGHTEVPEDIKQLCLDIVVNNLRRSLQLTDKINLKLSELRNNKYELV